eukprot:6839993-Prymnesium_polylepis.1
MVAHRYGSSAPEGMVAHHQKLWELSTRRYGSSPPEDMVAQHQKPIASEQNISSGARGASNSASHMKMKRGRVAGWMDGWTVLAGVVREREVASQKAWLASTLAPSKLRTVLCALYAAFRSVHAIGRIDI